MILLDLINLKKIRKAIIYLAVIIATLALQTLVFSRISLFGIKAMFVPVMIVAIGMFEGGVWGGTLGLVTGVLLDMALSASGVTFTVILPVTGFLSGFLAQLYINKKFIPCVLLCLAALLAAAMCQALPLFFFAGSSFSAVMRAVALQTLYSLPFSAPAFFLARGLNRKENQ